MSIIAWIVLGLIAGFIASKIVNKVGQGFWLDIALGIIGALVGGFIFESFGGTGVTGFNLYSMFVAVIGAIIVLAVYHAVTVAGLHRGLSSFQPLLRWSRNHSRSFDHLRRPAAFRTAMATAFL